MLYPPAVTTSGSPATTRPVPLGMAAAVGMAVFLPLAFWATRFHLVPTADGRWRGLSDPPGLALMIVAAALAGLVAWRLAGTEAAPPLLVLGIAAAPLVTVLTGRFSGLLVFQGPALVVVAAAVLGAALARATPRPWLSRIRPGAATLFALTFAAYALLSLRLPGAAGPQGDEPHYLAMAQSLLSDGDLDLTDEFRDREYASFFAGVLEPHTSPASPRGKLYAIHTPGLPALILPGYALAGFRGAQLLLSLVAALTTVVVFRVVADLSTSPSLPFVAWALVAFAPPLPVYAVSVYPETFAALALALFLWRARGVNGWGALLAVALVAAFLPWMHPKFLPLATAGLALVVARPGPRLGRVLAAALLLLSLLALLGWLKATYGQATLTAAYGPGFASDVRAFNLPWGVLGLLLDRQYGLLTVAPVFVLAVPGAVALARERRDDALRALVLVGAAVGVGASFSMWWGGSCPPARFMVPAVPALAVLATFQARSARVLGRCVDGGILLGARAGRGGAASPAQPTRRRERPAALACPGPRPRRQVCPPSCSAAGPPWYSERRSWRPSPLPGPRAPRRTRGPRGVRGRGHSLEGSPLPRPAPRLPAAPRGVGRGQPVERRRAAGAREPRRFPSSCPVLPGDWDGTRLGSRVASTSRPGFYHLALRGQAPAARARQRAARSRASSCGPMPCCWRRPVSTPTAFRPA